MAARGWPPGPPDSFQPPQGTLWDWLLGPETCPRRRPTPAWVSRTGEVALPCCLAPCPGGGAAGQACRRLRRCGRGPGRGRAGEGRPREPSPLPLGSPTGSAPRRASLARGPLSRKGGWRHRQPQSLSGRSCGGGHLVSSALPERARFPRAALQGAKQLGPRGRVGMGVSQPIAQSQKLPTAVPVLLPGSCSPEWQSCKAQGSASCSKQVGLPASPLY